MDKTNIAIYGASGHGKVLAQMASNLGYNILFVDDGDNIHLSLENFLLKHGTKIPFVIGIGDNRIRRVVYEDLKNIGCKVISLVDKSAHIADSVIIGEGTVIMPGVIVNTKAGIEEGVILNSGSVIEHECHIKAFAHISPNVALAGNVTVGENTHVGIGSCIIQNIQVGSNVVIGAGSVVIKDIDANSLVVGNPAKKVRELDA